MDALSWASHMSTCTTIMRGRTRDRSHANNVSSAADPTAEVLGTPPSVELRTIAREEKSRERRHQALVHAALVHAATLNARYTVKAHS